MVLHHPLFPPSPSSVIAFPQTLLSDSHSSPLLLHKFFMCYISFSVGLSTKLPNKQFVFPISLFSACSLACYLAKGNPFGVKRKGHHHWCWTSNYYDIRCVLGNTYIKVAPYCQCPSTFRHIKGRQDTPVRQKHGSLNYYQPSKEPQIHKWTDPSHKGMQIDALS